MYEMKNIIHLKDTAWKSWDTEKLIGDISENVFIFIFYYTFVQRYLKLYTIVKG